MTARSPLGLRGVATGNDSGARRSWRPQAPLKSWQARAGRRGHLRDRLEELLEFGQHVQVQASEAQRLLHRPPGSTEDIEIWVVLTQADVGWIRVIHAARPDLEPAHVARIASGFQLAERLKDRGLAMSLSLWLGQGKSGEEIVRLTEEWTARS